MGEANAVFTPLLEGEYFRAGKIGDGAYGDVLKVFDEDGTAFAAKRFEPDEEEGDGSIEAGALREVAILRILDTVKHPNLISIHDLLKKNFGDRREQKITKF